MMFERGGGTEFQTPGGENERKDQKKKNRGLSLKAGRRSEDRESRAKV